MLNFLPLFCDLFLLQSTMATTIPTIKPISATPPIELPTAIATMFADELYIERHNMTSLPTIHKVS